MMLTDAQHRSQGHPTVLLLNSYVAAPIPCIIKAVKSFEVFDNCGRFLLQQNHFSKHLLKYFEYFDTKILSIPLKIPRGRISRTTFESFVICTILILVVKVMGAAWLSIYRLGKKIHPTIKNTYRCCKI